MVQLNCKWLLLFYIANTTAFIMNGDGEECGSPVDSVCGYGSYCTENKICRCVAGFAFRTTRPKQGARPAIYYCLDICNLSGNTCPIGTTCKEIQLRKYRCDCNEDYMRSLLGQCISTSTELPTFTTKDKEPTTQTKITDISTADPLPLYIGLGVGIASFVLLIIILVIIIVFVRRRNRSRRSPPSVSGEGGTVINNNLTITTPNARGEGTNRYSECSVDLSDESNVNSNGNPQKNPTPLTQPSRTTYHHSAAYEDIDNIFQTEGTDLNSRIPNKFDNSESNDNIKSGLKEKQNLKVQKISNKKDKVKIFNLETSAITEGRVGKEGEGTHVLKKQYDGQDTNPYQTPYDLTPFSTNQHEETAAKGKALEVENNMNESPYSLAQRIGGATDQNSKMEEQTTARIENDYDELSRQILSKKDKSFGQC